MYTSPSSAPLHSNNPTSALDSSFGRSWKGRRKVDEEESQQRRMSSWAVFGAVMDEDSFRQAMDDRSKPLRKRRSAPTVGAALRGPDEAMEESRRWASAGVSASSSVTSFRPLQLQQQEDADAHLLADGRLTSEPSSYMSLPQRPPDEEDSAEDDVSDTSDDEGELQDGRRRRRRWALPSIDVHDRISQTLAAWTTASPRLGAVWQLARRGLDLKAHHRTIIKCSIAYLIASLFTFVPPLSRLISESFDIDGPFSSAHTLATIVTYYRPAPTPGAMMQANGYAVAGLLWTAVLVLGSMSTAVGLNNLDLEWLSHAIILVVWIGFGYALIAYAKQKRSNPFFSTTCSMICVISSVIITREGSVHFGYFEFTKLKIYATIALLGVAISNIVCLTLWRGSATGKLQADINKALDSFSTLFTVLVKTFLLDDSITLKGDRLKRAIDSHNASFTALQKSLDEASLEFCEPLIKAAETEYKELVASLTRLAQHLTGLRSGCGLQNELMRAARSKYPTTANWDLQDNDAAKDELAPARKVFEVFRERVGPSLKALMVCGNKTLHTLRASFREPSDAEKGFGVDGIRSLRPVLLRALEDFGSAHSDEMKRLYREAPAQVELTSGGVESFVNTLDTSRVNEEIFLIYFFLFSLEEFVRELSHLVDVFAALKLAEEAVELRKANATRFFRAWACCVCRPKKQPTINKRRGTLGQTLGRIFPVDPRSDRDSPFPLKRGSEGDQNRREELTWWQSLKRRIHDISESLSQPDVRFAAKVGLGAACLSAPAFLRMSRPIYEEYKGQWAIVSYMVVMSSTVGQTNLLALLRFLGTLVGAGVAVLVYHMFWEDPVVLPVVGFFVSLPCFWIMVCRPAFASSGRFLLLSYNLTCLYSYNVREDEVHILEVAYHRVVSVLVGVLWGWIVTNFVWPYKARRELRVELSAFLLGCAFLYSHLVRQYSTPPTRLGECNPNDEDHLPHCSPSMLSPPMLSPRLDGNGETAPLLTHTATHHLDDSVRDFLNMELFLQVKLINLNSLLAATKHEPRLKGPFPVEAYRSMLASAQTILDMFHSMRAITTRPRWYTSVRRDFVMPVQRERREMVGSVILFFSCLATSVELKAPLPPWLPPAAKARERLLEKIRELPVVKRRLVKGRSDYLLYFAYSVAMKTVIQASVFALHRRSLLLTPILQHLEIMGQRAQELYGVIGGVQSAADFATLFESQGEQLAEHALEGPHLHQAA